MKNNWTKGMDMGFVDGQKAWHNRLGWGTVRKKDGDKYPFIWTYDNAPLSISFMIDGCEWETDNAPSFFHKEQELNISKPEWQPQPGELVWVWNEDYIVPNSRVFYNIEDEYFFCHSVKSMENMGIPYANCAPFNNGQLPDEFKHLLKGGDK